MKLSVAEIQQVCRKLGKEEVPVEETKRLLEQLKDGVVATEEVLRATGAGQRLNKIALYHKDKTIREDARDLRDKWKATLRSSSGVTKTKTVTRKAAATATAIARAVSSIDSSSTASTPVPKSPSVSSRTKGSVDRTADSDKVDWKVTGNPTRDGCIKLLYNGLVWANDESPDAILEVAVKVEAAGYAHFNSNTETGYKGKMRSLFQNLRNKSNPDLARNVFHGRIPPARFVAMNDEELKSDKLRDEEARMKKMNKNNAMVAQVEKSISRTFECGKCKKRMVSYHQAQTRSADEPMTTFCECLNCGNRWKFS